MPRRLILALALLASTCAGRALALDDGPPEAWLATLQGEWEGSLTYRDYSDPHRLVTLPTRLFVALGSPNELVLHYVYDDGPKKTVDSYETMTFDWPKRQLTWRSGGQGIPSAHRITSDTTIAKARTVGFERVEKGTVKRYTFAAEPGRWTLSEDEVAPDGTVTFRNRHAFTRAEPPPTGSGATIHDGPRSATPGGTPR